MKKTETAAGQRDIDRELDRRFAGLRREEMATAPTFSAMSAPKPEGSSRHVQPRLAPTLPRLAAAAAATAIALTVFYSTEDDDPARLYAGIMQDQILQTDALLNVSESVLPAMHTLPQLYHLDSLAVEPTHSNEIPATETSP